MRFKLPILRGRTEQAAIGELRGKLDAIGRSQAVIEFDLEGVILAANANFLALMGYAEREVSGQRHATFVEPAQRDGPEYRAFWAGRKAGRSSVAEDKRVDNGGREVWNQSSYDPSLDLGGKPFKVVTYASDVTGTKLRNADFPGQVDAIGKSQAVIAFALTREMLSANDTFLDTMGYAANAVIGQHHSMQTTPAAARPLTIRVA